MNRNSLFFEGTIREDAPGRKLEIDNEDNHDPRDWNKQAWVSLAGSNCYSGGTIINGHVLIRTADTLGTGRTVEAMNRRDTTLEVSFRAGPFSGGVHTLDYDLHLHRDPSSVRTMRVINRRNSLARSVDGLCLAGDRRRRRSRPSRGALVLRSPCRIACSGGGPGGGTSPPDWLQGEGLRRGGQDAQTHLREGTGAAAAVPARWRLDHPSHLQVHQVVGGEPLRVLRRQMGHTTQGQHEEMIGRELLFVFGGQLDRASLSQDEQVVGRELPLVVGSQFNHVPQREDEQVIAV